MALFPQTHRGFSLVKSHSLKTKRGYKHTMRRFSKEMKIERLKSEAIAISVKLLLCLIRLRFHLYLILFHTRSINGSTTSSLPLPHKQFPAFALLCKIANYYTTSLCQNRLLCSNIIHDKIYSVDVTIFKSFIFFY